MNPSYNPHHRTKMPVREARQLLRLSVVLWLLGMPGVVALSLQLGHVLPGSTLAPEWMSGLVAAQLGLLLLGAVFIGAWCAPRLGLPTPLWQAFQAGKGQRDALNQMFLPALGGGIVGAAWMVSLAQWTPEGFAYSHLMQALPLWVKLLAAVTLELLIHWGFMATVLFVLWRVCQPRSGFPRGGLVFLSVLLSAMLLCAVVALLSQVAIQQMAHDMLYFVAMEFTLWGMVTGYIFWRYGLEAAILAHMLALAFSHGLT